MSLHCMSLHCILLQCTACTACYLHPTLLNKTTLFCTTLNLHFTAFHCSLLDFTNLEHSKYSLTFYAALYFTAIHFKLYIYTVTSNLRALYSLHWNAIYQNVWLFPEYELLCSYIRGEVFVFQVHSAECTLHSALHTAKVCVSHVVCRNWGNNFNHVC